MAGAASALRDLLREQPEHVEARTSMAQALYGMGDADGAIEELRAVLRQAPDAGRARLALAAALTAKQDWAGARAELEEALRRDPELTQAYYTLGLVRYTQGDLAGAIDAYRRVLARDPGQTDARYNLGLMLKLAHRDAEAAGELLSAARSGVPRAQYFVGTAYATGAGVERNLPLGLEWWFRAAEQGVAQADEALAQIRAVARGRGRRGTLDRSGAEAAFREFRERMWTAFPEVPRSGAESLGARLLQDGRARDAIPVLIREALALDESVEPALESLYEVGAPPQVAPHDARILQYLHTAAGEGRVPARIALARIYGHGLGVPQDLSRAIAWLRPLPGDEAQRLLRELTGAPTGASAPARR
jgi:TPR repeat protein